MSSFGNKSLHVLSLGAAPIEAGALLLAVGATAAAFRVLCDVLVKLCQCRELLFLVRSKGFVSHLARPFRCRSSVSRLLHRSWSSTQKSKALHEAFAGIVACRWCGVVELAIGQLIDSGARPGDSALHRGYPCPDCSLVTPIHSISSCLPSFQRICFNLLLQ